MFLMYYNFCRVHSTIGTRPAVASDLADHVWTIDELLVIAAERLSAPIGTQCLTLQVTSLSSVAASGGQTREIIRSSIYGASIMRSDGGNRELSATIGRPDAGLITGGNVELAGGYWFQIPSGDVTDDGLVSLADFVQLSNCLAGPGAAPLPAECHPMDLDHNSALDLGDVAVFQRESTGH